ncbi:amino acid permease/ SLC12A domain-containing protein [Phyllosticta citriasiana]|uniref:Amino acid permease/ SLC12A domain-containing protein n=1 Tax=Phyllosticta citriasiana TaxID=595635 RepID=A0ABR1KQ51_9PEZI
MGAYDEKGTDAIANATPTTKAGAANGAHEFPGSEGSSTQDLEKQGPNGTQELKRNLKSRHLQMIAIGGTIGTGLFIGSGEAIAEAGPAGALIAYAFIGTIVYSVCVCLAEMATYIPVSGAFCQFAARFIHPSLGFAMGWIYWVSWALTYALELTASGLIIQYWDRDLSIAIFIAIFWVVITAINFLPVKFYGELEFWFAGIKVLLVIGFTIFAICVDAGVGKNGYIGFKYWGNPGAFAPYLVTDNDSTAKFVGFWAVLIQAGFTYQGTELVGIGAGETANPRKTVPSAIRNTFWMIFIFFMAIIFFVGLLVPYDNEGLLSQGNDASSSPLVIAAKLAGIKTLPGIINGVLLTVVLSAANANVYSGSRMIIGLADAGCAPKFLAKTTSGGVPYWSVAFTASIGLLAFMNLSSTGGSVFDWFQNISGVAGFISWGCINWCQIAFMRILKVRGISRQSLPYIGGLQPFTAWYGLFFNVLIILTQGFTAFMPWNTSDFFVAYVSLILFVVLFVVHMLVTGSKFVNPMEADIDTGRLQPETEVWEESSDNFFSRMKSRIRG